MRSLPARDLANLAAQMRTVTFDRGEHLLREEDVTKGFFMIVSGSVTMRRHGRHIGTVRGPGAVGLLSLLARDLAGTSAIADSFVEAYEVPKETMEDIFEDHVPVMLGTLRWVSSQLIAANLENEPPAFSPPTIPIDKMVGERELGLVERIFVLRQMGAFKEANVSSLATLVRKMEELRLPAGEVLWRRGDPSDATYFVVKGMLDLVWDEKRSQEVGPGYVVGGAETIAGSARWNDLVTKEPVVMLRGSREGLIELFEDDRDIGLKFLSLLAKFLMGVWDKRAEAGILSVGTAASVPDVVAFETARPSNATLTEER